MVTQISIIARDGSATSDNVPSLGSKVDVAINDNTKFAVQDNVDLASLPFTPDFSRATISKGQNVEVDSDGAMTTPVAARKIKLHQQALTGTASNVQTNSFTLTVAVDSAFAMLTGMQTVTVNRTSSTELKDISSVTEGTTVRVRGLLFFDGSSYRIVARRIGNP